MSKLTVALVAHDHKKPELLTWVKNHIKVMEQCDLVATGTTGGLISDETGLEVKRYKSGPLGGDQQIGALIAENKLDALFFFWDPLNAAPHDLMFVRYCDYVRSGMFLWHVRQLPLT